MLPSTSQIAPGLMEPAVHRVPNELWFDILRLLRRDRSTLLSVSQVCKRLRSLTIPVLLHQVTLDLVTSPDHASSFLAMLGSNYDSGRFVRRMQLKLSTRDVMSQSTLTDVWELLKVVSVEDLVLSSSKLSARLFDALITIPTLQSLNLQNCTIYPPDPIIPLETKDCDQPRSGRNLTSLEVTWQEASMTSSLPAILSRLDMSKLQHLSLAGSPCSGAVTTELLNTVSPGSLKSFRFPPARRDARFPDPYGLLRDNLVNQPHIRHLSLHPKIHLTSIPADALPNLERFEGSYAMAELLVPGRPVTQVTITTESNFSANQGDMPQTFKAIAKSSKPVKYLELEEIKFEEEWMDDLRILFPQLEHLRVQSINFLSKVYCNYGVS
ncbi:hypothetical protein CALCODRAFT_506024 [Calocera cornea HHB12733]|uniref:F-box domain-containing protein n=1 Tax=Calocera cornea HHB12733 TaxID=1353952 RepID=A0A165JD07_9BASI|nr:hypothetical protein CALCODRAFT_506024 [Calocera cornea HHB12733]